MIAENDVVQQRIIIHSLNRIIFQLACTFSLAGTTTTKKRKKKKGERTALFCRRESKESYTNEPVRYSCICVMKYHVIIK